MIQIDCMSNGHHLIQETFLGQLWQASDCSHRIHGLFVHLRHAAAGRVVGGHFVGVDRVPRGQWNWGRMAKWKRMEKGHGLRWVSCFSQEFKKALLHPCSIYSWSYYDGEGRWASMTLLAMKITWTYIYIYGTGPGPAGPPPPWYGPKTCVLQHSAWKRWIWSVFCTVGGWRGPQTCKFVGFLQPAFRKRVLCNVSASTSWGSAVAPPSMSSCHIIPNLLI